MHVIYERVNLLQFEKDIKKPLSLAAFLKTLRLKGFKTLFVNLYRLLWIYLRELHRQF
jgi:hypothetical protein